MGMEMRILWSGRGCGCGCGCACDVFWCRGRGCGWRGLRVGRGRLDLREGRMRGMGMGRGCILLVRGEEDEEG